MGKLKNLKKCNVYELNCALQPEVNVSQTGKSF